MSDRSDRPPSETATPKANNATDPDRQLHFVEELLQARARVAGDVIEIAAHTWAIHGSVLVDGDVIMAEFDTEERARTVLNELSRIEDGTGSR